MKDQAARYVLSTFVTAPCSLLLPIVLHEWAGLSPSIAVALGLASAFMLGFLTTRYFVFRSYGDAGSQLLRLAIASLAFRAAEYVAFLVLHTLLGMQYAIALVFVLGTSFCAKFFVQRSYVYRMSYRGAPDQL